MPEPGRKKSYQLAKGKREKLMKNVTDRNDRNVAQLMRDRTITASDANIVATSSPSYLFSTRASYDTFKQQAIIKSQQATQALASNNMLSEITIQLNKLIAFEEEKAIEICNALNLTGGNPRDLVKDYFNKAVGAKMPTGFDVEGVIYYMFKEELDEIFKDKTLKTDKFLKNVITKRQKDIGKYAREIENLLKEVEQTSFNKFKGGVNIDYTLAPVYEKFQKLKESAKNENLIQLVRTGKGTLQEMIDYVYLAKAFEGMKIDFKLDLVGAIKQDETKLIQTVVKKVNDGLQVGSKMSGITDSKIQSDIILTVTSAAGKVVTIPFSVKSTVATDGNRATYRFSKKTDFEYTIDKLRAGSDPVIDEAISYGLIVLISSFTLMAPVSSYGAQDQVLRPLAALALNTKDFLENFFFDGITNGIPDPNFHYLLLINNKVYWFSDILKTIKDDLTDFNSPIYKDLLYLNNYDSLSTTAQEANKIYNRKRTVLRSKAARGLKTYGERLQLLLSDPKLMNMLKRYSDASKSLSVKINTSSFDVQ